MASIKITRSSEFVNRLRKIKFFVDGKEIGALSNGETKDFEIAPGDHTLQAKIDWCCSNKLSFTITANEVRSFSMTSFAQHNPFGTFATIYYITFGTKKYLRLVEN